MQIESKICTGCEEEKLLCEFHKQKNGKFGVTSTCKSCKKKYWEKGKKTFSVNAQKRYNKNKKERLINQKKYYETNKHSKIKEYKSKNKDKISKYNKSYHLNPKNRVKINKQRKQRYKKNIEYRLSCILRSRFFTAIKNDYKKSSCEKLLKMPIKDFKLYIENQMIGSMSWDNHGILWELDHIKPIYSFDLTKIKNQKKCFNYKNYQPLYTTTELAIKDGCENCEGNRNKHKK